WITRYATDNTASTATGKRSFTVAGYFNQLTKINDMKIDYSEHELKETEEFLKRLKLWLTSVNFFYLVPSFMRHYIPGLIQLMPPVPSVFRMASKDDEVAGMKWKAGQTFF
ncbi:4811_t:CDS:2, partial [Diversispora eburnea]